MERVSILGSFIDVINALRTKSEGNEINKIIADRESVLKKYGDKRLLVEVMAEKDYERVYSGKAATNIRTRIKASGGAGGGKGISTPMNVAEPTIENDDRDRR